MQNLHNDIDFNMSRILQAYRNRKSAYIMALLTALEINFPNQGIQKLFSLSFFPDFKQRDKENTKLFLFCFSFFLIWILWTEISTFSKVYVPLTAGNERTTVPGCL